AGDGGTGDDVPLAAAPRDRPLPLSFGQQRLWFLDQLEPGSPLYNVPAAVRLRGRLDVKALERSLDAVAARHEAMRARIVLVDGQPAKVFDGPAHIPLEPDDLRSLPREAADAQALERAAREATVPFDLTHGPLLRGRLLAVADDEWLLVLTAHHVV